jgi:hypothetical protein
MRRGYIPLLWLCTACAIFPRAVELPDDDVATALVMSETLGAPMDAIARHAFIVVRGPKGREWTRWEVFGPGRSRVNRSGGNPLRGKNLRLHGVLRGDEAARFIRCLEKAAPAYGEETTYVFYPGPNSNTFVDAMLRACNFHAELASTSVGKDWRGLIGVSVTSGGTGLQLETPLVGLKIGLTEGIEIHILSLSFGIDLWPPAIIVPVGDGRIGFADR